MKRYLCLFVILIVPLLFGHAQLIHYSEIEVLPDTTTYRKLYTGYGLYFHTGIKPGLSFSAEYPLIGRLVKKPRFSVLGYSLFSQGKMKQILRQGLLQMNTGLYVHPKNHTGLYMNAMLIYRVTNQKGWLADCGAGMGILRAFLPKTYEFTEAGVKKVFLPGRSFLTANTALSIGKRFIIKQKPIFLFTRHSFYILMPYNNILNFGYSIEWGLRYKLIKNPKFK